MLFRRTALTGPLPEPQPGGQISDLWDWLNVAKEDRPLVAAALVAALFSEQPHVVLAIFGEQGTGKTTALKVLVLLLDPGPVPVRKPPRDADSWVTAAAGSWVVGLDNLSDVPPWLSDSLCRASTGDGDVRRKLYSDADYAVFAFRRCIIFDAIDVGALAPDLADRTVAITLDLIADEDRQDEETFWSRWAATHPQLLGAVLDLAARVMARLPEIRLARKPRMADYARILAAVDAELGTDAFGRYAQQAANLAAEGLSGDSLAARIQAVIDGHLRGHVRAVARAGQAHAARRRVEAAEGLASQHPGRHRQAAQARARIPQDRLGRGRPRQRQPREGLPLENLSARPDGDASRGCPRTPARPARSGERG